MDKMSSTRKIEGFWFWAMVFIVATIIATVQSLLLPLKTFEQGGIHYTEYNNYIIFKQSFYHLIHHQDLFILYPTEQWDLFKYSPTFALLMAPLAILPNFLGLFIWNLLNTMVLYFAMWQVPFASDKKRMLAFAFILIELITSIQNTQSNGLIAGLIVLAYIFLEKKRVGLAALFITLTVFIKLFGIIAFLLFLLYPDKIKAICYSILWFVMLTLLPLLVISPSGLLSEYKSWALLLHNDQVINYGLSVMGWIYTWFGISLNKTWVVLVGGMILLVPMLNIKAHQFTRYRVYYLAAILLWVIIFNHKAESPTFIIAAVGIAIWYFYEKQGMFDTSLLITAFVFTILSATDLFPTSVKRNFLEPYVLKAVPCIFIWIRIIYEMLFMKEDLRSQHRGFASS
ncbi:MAG: glycosyltransferase family 87 protein [Ginsengibacter sp.]